MFTYVMKSKIEELIEEKLNQEFPEEVEISKNQDFDSDEEMTLETEETDDDEQEPNNTNVNNYLDSANMAMNLESVNRILTCLTANPPVFWRQNTPTRWVRGWGQTWSLVGRF